MDGQPQFKNVTYQIKHAKWMDFRYRYLLLSPGHWLAYGYSVVSSEEIIITIIIIAKPVVSMAYNFRSKLPATNHTYQKMCNSQGKVMTDALIFMEG